MDLRQDIYTLLKKIGPGQQITRSAYDTAWVARLQRLDETIGEEALEWLRENQLADGSWGASEPCYYHDRVVSTLAAMTAFASQRGSKDRIRWRRAQLALEKMIQGLGADPAGATIGFEMIVPTLVSEAEELGIIKAQDDGVLSYLTRYRASKLASLPDGMINRYVTVAFSTEMVGLDGLHLLDVENLQEENGSVAYSPSSTAFFALYVHPQNPSALRYLDQVAASGAVPYTAPIDVFEQAWSLWNLAMAGPLESEVLDLCQPHLDFLEATWNPGRGIAAVSGLTLLDGDTTAMVYEVLTRYGRSVDLEGILHYEQGSHFRCFPLEANPSISTNVHILSALRLAGCEVDHPWVTKTLEFLWRSQTLQLLWFDKWHASPYYTTSHAIIACAGFVDWLVDDAVYWIIETQNSNGSWGYYMPTAEETAYCLQALVAWKRSGRHVPKDTLKRGAAWLADHAEPPYPPLWIGKGLYCPVFVVRSAVLSALMLIAQG